MACLRQVLVASVASSMTTTGFSSPCSSARNSQRQNLQSTTWSHRFLKSNSASFSGRLHNLRLPKRSKSSATSEDDIYLPDLRIPQEWVSPEAAKKESEWLRGALHQWLDDEFCPEPANEEISKRCAKVYYYCLLEKQLDIGDILMQMVRDLETFSFKESFHGSFSSANAAIALITNKMRSREPNTMSN